MFTYRYVVVVTTDTKEHADQVMAERMDFDEDYGFRYSLEYFYADIPQ